MAKPDLVYITHEATDAVGLVVRSAFEGEHKGKGWKMIDESEVTTVTDDDGFDRYFKAKSKGAAAAVSTLKKEA